MNLFPYGRGGPEPLGSFKISGPYLCHLLRLGREREFQQSPGFIFYSYSFVMKQRSGTISFLATKNGQEDKDPVKVSVADAKEFLAYIEANKNVAVAARPTAPADLITETKMKLLMNRLLPYATLLVGTELYMKAERRKLLSMISAAVTNDLAMWAVFFTEAQPDKYLSEIYDNAITSAVLEIDKPNWYEPDVHIRRNLANKLSKSDRREILKAHPLMSARIHAAQQSVFWKYIICGEDQPFGEVLDYWRRVEFQERGTPHSHNLINIRIKPDGVSEDSLTRTTDTEENLRQRALVMEKVCSFATATLEPRHECDLMDLPEDTQEHEHFRVREQHFEYKVDRLAVKDADYPCKERFHAAGRSFHRNVLNEIEDSSVQSQYRRLQTVNQMHVCQPSCFKYCKSSGPQVCRYDFPKKLIAGNFDSATIISCKDRRGRQRIRVEPPRNNAHLNVCCTSPLIVLACKGNHDVQYIANKCGGGEYVSKYASKTDTADCRAMLNAINRKLAAKTIYLLLNESLTLRSTLRAVSSALVSAQQIGAVHACYVLCQASSLVQSTRQNVYVNALHRDELTQLPIELDMHALEDMEEDDNALATAVGSTMGKRDAYAEFYKYHVQQFEECLVDFYSLLSAYRIKSHDPSVKKSIVPEGLSGPLRVDSGGFVINPKSFILKEVCYCMFNLICVVIT